MLHELVHNVRGPHDAVFYKLLDEITEVCFGPTLLPDQGWTYRCQVALCYG